MGQQGKEGMGQLFIKRLGKVKVVNHISNNCTFLNIFYCLGDNNLAVPDTVGGNMGSRASCRDITLMENILDWQSVIKKYYAVVKTQYNPN